MNSPEEIKDLIKEVLEQHTDLFKKHNDCIKELMKRVTDLEDQMNARHRAKFYGQLPNKN
jgi:Glu-tRNA(Gln) amidotransferase subunit E-like FAD-binding protein